MSYLVLARKCRPQVFEEVLGQHHVTQTLQNALKTGRTAHAYLFSGPRGVGKTTVARILAKALNCQEGPTPVPCNRCVSCREITQGISLDVQEIDGASNRGIDDIRELRESIKYLPNRSRYKIYIIDEVHMLTGEAFNALLKTLEEPPPHALFIFATTELNKVPLTIYSRCQSFHFRRVPLNAVVGYLKSLCAKEQVAVEEGALRLLARQSDGSVRDSLSLLDQILSFSGDRITEAQVQEILGFVDRRVINDAAWAILENERKGLLERIAEVYEYGYDLKQFLRDLIEYLRNLLLMRLGYEDESLVDLPAEERPEIRKRLDTLSLEVLQEVLHFLVHSEGELRRAPQPRLALEMMLLRAAQLKECVPLDALLEKLDRLQEDGRGLQKTDPSPTEPPAVPPDAPLIREKPSSYTLPSSPTGEEKKKNRSPDAAAVDEGKEEVRSGEKGDFSQEPFKEPFLEYVRQHHLPLAAYLSHGEPRWLDERTLAWDFRSDPFQLQLLEANSNKKKLEHLTRDYFKRDIRLLFLGGERESSEVKKGGTAETSRSKRPTIREALSYPQIRDLVDIFQAEVTEVRLPPEKRSDTP